MRRTKIITLQGIGEIAVRELTVGEIRNWMRDLETGGAIPDIVDALLIVDIQLSDLQRVTDLAPSGIDALSQSDIGTLMTVIKELNPLFFGLLGRLAEARTRARQTARAPLKPRSVT